MLIELLLANCARLDMIYHIPISGKHNCSYRVSIINIIFQFIQCIHRVALLQSQGSFHASVYWNLLQLYLFLACRIYIQLILNINSVNNPTAQGARLYEVLYAIDSIYLFQGDNNSEIQWRAHVCTKPFLGSYRQPPQAVIVGLYRLIVVLYHSRNELCVIPFAEFFS